MPGARVSVSRSSPDDRIATRTHAAVQLARDLAVVAAQPLESDPVSNINAVLDLAHTIAWITPARLANAHPSIAPYELYDAGPA
jgi:hypothetical protein